jgi:hypothetical protein
MICRLAVSRVGNACTKEQAPSDASRVERGERSGAYRASAQCASAFVPLAALACRGKEVVFGHSRHRSGPESHTQRGLVQRERCPHEAASSCLAAAAPTRHPSRSL